MRRGAICALVAPIMLIGGCRKHDSREKTEPGPRPDMIVYMVDTLRPDHLGVYGYERDTTPRVDEFAKDAIVFRRAYAPSSWTKPSAASLLTGLHPQKHGAITRADRMSERVTLLGERLGTLGYHTAAFMANPNVIGLWGFDQGFDRFYEMHGETVSRADHVIAAVFTHLQMHSNGAFFYYIHTMDPHSPYDPPPPFDRKWPRKITRPVKVSQFVERGPPELTPELVAAYDGEIAFTDHHFGRLLDHLKSEGLYRDALIIFASDHGEEFREHGKLLHGHTLYEELLRVPLIIKLPGNKRAGTTVHTPASLTDIAPTILSWLNQPIPAELDGTDLLAGTEQRPLYFDLDLERLGYQGEMWTARGVLAGTHKYVRTTAPQADEMLFDLQADPGEQRNLIEADPGRAAEMALLLTVFQSHLAAGVHLRLLNYRDTIDRAFEGTLKTTGRFADLRRWRFEAPDRAELSDDGKTLTFRVIVHNHHGARPKQGLFFVDEDHISFTVQPPESEIVFEHFTCDALSGLPLFAGPDQRRVSALPLKLRLADRELWVPDVTTLLRRKDRQSPSLPGGCYLAVVPPRERLEAEIDPQLRERLRALGYAR